MQPRQKHGLPTMTIVVLALPVLRSRLTNPDTHGPQVIEEKEDVREPARRGFPCTVVRSGVSRLWSRIPSSPQSEEKVAKPVRAADAKTSERWTALQVRRGVFSGAMSFCRLRRQSRAFVVDRMS